jgi:hypothetical protein
VTRRADKTSDGSADDNGSGDNGSGDQVGTRLQQLQQGRALHGAAHRNPSLAALIATGTPFIRCNQCGFVVLSPDPVANQAAADGHTCEGSTIEDVMKHGVWAAVILICVLVIPFAILVAAGKFDI